MRDPIVRKASVEVAAWPAGQPPLTILLLSDTHVAGPDMPPQRLARIVADLNRLRPDLVLVAGDLVSEKRVATHIYTAAEAVAPLAKSEEHTSALQSLMRISSAVFCLQKKKH